LKLILQGHTKNEDEPWPIRLAGEKEFLNSQDIEKYLGCEFWHYYKVYSNCKHCGLPFGGGWAEHPGWVPQLITRFEAAVKCVQNYNEEKAYEAARRKGHGVNYG
jgi:hypothetical protein